MHSMTGFGRGSHATNKVVACVEASSANHKQGEVLHPVVSRNSITTECADFQSVEDPALGQISDRAPRCRTVRLRQWT
ncbi:MAG: YicC/YloC family endoribonuclease [Roseibacillus sp.]